MRDRDSGKTNAAVEPGSRPLLLTARQIVTCAGAAPKRGSDLDDAGVIDRGALLVANGVLEDVGPEADVRSRLGGQSVTEHRFPNRVLAPGFVDAHTHAIFAGNRAREFERRLRGEDYMAILESGGGILETVDGLRHATEENLVDQTLSRLDRMLEHGTTSAEVKSGYGLEVQAELKSLRVLERLRELVPIELTGTFLGAHAFPRGLDRSAYVTQIIEEMLPAVVDQGVVDSCDVFCDRGVFDLDQTRLIMERAVGFGLRLRIHSDEIKALGATELACSMGAASVDHLIAITDSGIQALSASRTVGVLLPGTSFTLGKTYAPARKMIENGCSIAIATDLNPGSCHNENMQFAFQLACATYRMTPAEAFNATTLNAAYSLGLDQRIGSLEKGKQADILVLDVEDYREIPYKLGVNHVEKVYKAGSIVMQRQSPAENRVPRTV